MFSYSSSVNEMSRKRKFCCGLSSCCHRQRSESAQMIAGKSTSSTQPPSKCQNFKNCMCHPFDRMCRPCKKQKVEGMDMEKESWWQRLCCCSSCCKRFTKKDKKKEKLKKASRF